jgi:hypothetical protein
MRFDRTQRDFQDVGHLRMGHALAVMEIEDGGPLGRELSEGGLHIVRPSVFRGRATPRSLFNQPCLLRQYGASASLPFPLPLVVEKAAEGDAIEPVGKLPLPR